MLDMLVFLTRFPELNFYKKKKREPVRVKLLLLDLSTFTYDTYYMHAHTISYRLYFVI